LISIGVIGGGAGGIMAAISAADNGASVTIIEKKDRLGKKILVTGNGRCNFSNESMGGNFYYSDSSDFVDDTLKRFGNDDLVSFFNSLGVLSKNKNGYYYPANEQASTVLEALEYGVRERKIDVVLNSDVNKIEKEDGKFIVSISDGRKFSFDRLIVSTGGKSSLGKNEQYNGYYLLKNAGHSMTRICPALTSLKCEGMDFKAVSGVRVDCKLSLYTDGELQMEDYGEVLFNDNGISGIVTFQISHCAIENARDERNVTVAIDLVPGVSETELENFCLAKFLTHTDISAVDFFSGLVNKKLAVEILKINGIDINIKVVALGFDSIKKCVKTIKKLILKVKGDAGFDKSQVTGGGIPLSEIKPSFESEIVSGLYIIGEVLNVDGICGGYNLQWAFSSGYIAGINASDKGK